MLFLLSVENEIHLVNIACWLQWSLCVLCCQNFKNKPLKKFKRGHKPGAPTLDPPLLISLFYGLKLHLRWAMWPTGPLYKIFLLKFVETSTSEQLQHLDVSSRRVNTQCIGKAVQNKPGNSKWYSEGKGFWWTYKTNW